MQRACFGPVGGGAVRFGMPRAGEWFAVGEGIETTLSVTTARALPGWAVLSANGIEALVLPPEATHVVVCADNDLHGRGQRAAEMAARRWMAEGRRVRVALPPADLDFNDVLTGHATATTNEVIDAVAA
jgi:putative DNA primase/helicase